MQIKFLKKKKEMNVKFMWLIYYISIKYMLLNYLDDQLAQDFFFEYRNVEASINFNYTEFDTLKWWIGFDLLALFLDLFSYIIGFGHLYMDVFGDEKFFLYNPCNTETSVYNNGDIVDKLTNEVVIDKNKVYYIKAFSLFCVSSVCVIAAYYLIS